MFQLFFLIFTFSFVQSARLQVIGNTAVLARHTDHVSYTNKALIVHVPKLWCGAQNLGVDVEVAYGHFIKDGGGKEIEGTIHGKHVFLEADKAPSTIAGKYKCEIRTKDGDVLSGNLIIYMAPVLHFPPGSTEVKEIPHTRPPKIIGTEISAKRGRTLTLKCPAFGYPQPFVRWELDGKAIAAGRAEFKDDGLKISSVKSSDGGVYRCTADNTFPIFVGGPAITHQLIYEQTVTVY